MSMEKLKRLLEREGTGISWADLTFNGWVGCTKVSPACDNCYAEALATARLGVAWGVGAPRRRTAPGNWSKPRRWNRIAQEAGHRLTVFCSSLADVFDNAVDDQWRADLAELIRDTPWLDWMLLTKRIGNARKMLAAMFPGGVPENVALGITICNQDEAERDIPKARDVKHALGIERLFLSCEPLIGPLDLYHLLFHECPNSESTMMDPETGAYECCSKCDFTGISDELAVDLVIVGGESGRGARHMPDEWAVNIGDQCRGAGARFHFKQQSQADHPRTYGKPETFPAELQVREHFA